MVVVHGAAEGEFDAAEIDKELISARLKQDVMEHAGKVHLFIADSVRLLISTPLISMWPLMPCGVTVRLHPSSAFPTDSRAPIHRNIRRRHRRF